MNAQNSMNHVSGRPRRHLRWGAITALVICWTHVCAPPVLAQVEASPPSESSSWLQWVCLVGFALLCCAIAFKNPKRTHQG
jgi:hypothetical protein